MRHADRPSVDEQLHVAAPPERIWPLVSDITFVVAPSEELQAVAWESGDGVEPAVGRRFIGTNRNEYFGEWQTTATVTECDPPHAFAWAVGDLDEPNTSWRFTLGPVAGGTLVTQVARLGYGPSGLHVAISEHPEHEERIVARRLEQFRAAMRANLEAIGRAVDRPDLERGTSVEKT